MNGLAVGKADDSKHLVAGINSLSDCIEQTISKFNGPDLLDYWYHSAYQWSKTASKCYNFGGGELYNKAKPDPDMVSGYLDNCPWSEHI